MVCALHDYMRRGGSEFSEEQAIQAISAGSCQHIFEDLERQLSLPVLGHQASLTIASLTGIRQPALSEAWARACLRFAATRGDAMSSYNYGNMQLEERPHSKAVVEEATGLLESALKSFTEMSERNSDQGSLECVRKARPRLETIQIRATAMRRTCRR